jgi:TolB-like protein/class 3 adenylate cyclase
MGETRKLAAILVSDVVGYSRLAGADEDRILARLRTLRSDLIDPINAVHHGRIVKRTGDGSIVEFRSVVDAVRCAIEVQNGMRERNAGVPEDQKIQFRVGIHVGDVVEESDGDLMGDGVNIAARLEGVAKPGGIALSEDAYRQVKARLDLTVNDLGSTQLKNIAEPVHVYSLEVGTDRKPSSSDKLDPKAAFVSPALPDKPSIAVLPFQNMSGNAEQEYFADGLVEDLITNLSKNPGLFVIARNSTFVYKGKAVDVRQVAKELGVRYVLEGSVRRAANRLRVTGQLVEGIAGAHVWADKFEGAVEDVFDLQDQLSQSIVGAIEPSLRRAEIDRARSKRPEALGAYDLYLRALPHAYANTIRDSEKAIQLLNEALRHDPNYAIAHAIAAWSYEQRFFRGGFDPKDRTAALEHARAALRTGADDAQALSIAAFVDANITHDYERAIPILDTALRLNGNSALAYGFSSLVYTFSERFPTAREHALKALRLSPFDPLNYHAYESLAIGALFSDRDEEALTYSSQAVQSNASFSVNHALLVASYVKLGRIDEAAGAAQRLLEIVPDFTVAGFVRMQVMSLWKALADDLRKAGLPEQ